MSAPPVYQLKDLRIDVGRRTVTRDAADIPLPKLSFDLFLMLIESAPNVVSTDQFMDTVWKGLVVSPETVGQRVKLLRDALGDDARNPTYIAGVRGLGYRLIVPVSREAPAPAPVLPDPVIPPPVADAAPPAAAAPAVTAPVAPPARRRTRGILAVLALLGVAGVALFLALRHRPPATSVTLVGAPYSAVAVLPLANISADHRDDYIATGLSEMIQNRLAGVSTLRVVARTSAEAARDQKFGLEEIRDKLHAKYVVDGSLQHAGDQLRVTAQVTDTDSGRQLVAIHLDKPLSEIFELQDDIADRIATALAVRVGDTHFKPDKARNAATAAYLEYLQGRAFIGHFSISMAHEATAHFSKAIEIDPNFAAAYAALALATHWTNAGEASAKLAAASQVRELQLVDRALALDADLGEAYITRAYVRERGQDPAVMAQVEADFKKGIELSPNYSLGYIFYAEALNDWNRPDEATGMLDRARLIDPLQPRIPYIKALYLATAEFQDPDTDKALKAIQTATDLMHQTLELDPQYTNALARMGQWEAVLYGHFAEAVRLTERALQVDSAAVWLRSDLADMYLGAGDPDGLRGMIAASPQGTWFPQVMVALYAGDWRTAAELEFHRPEEAPVDLGVPPFYAVQLWGQHTKNFARAESYIREHAGIKPGHEFEPPLFDESLAMALVVLQSGDHARARALGEQALAVLKKFPENTDDLDSWMPPLAARACVHLLLGQNDLGLDELQRSLRFKTRYAFPYAWMLDQNPLFDPVRNDPRFRAVLDELHANTAAQHALLEQMRAKGEVPTRKF